MPLGSYSQSSASSGTARARLDWTLVWSVAALLLIGSLAVFSAASPLAYYHQILQRHLLALAIGALAFAFGMGLNYQVYQDQSKAAYALALGLLVGVLLFGDTLRGTRGWFRFPYFSFQPSEIARILTLLVLADYLVRRGHRVREVATVAGAIALAAPVLALILMEPDFSSTVVFYPTLLAMLFCAGARVTHLAALAGYGLIAGALPLARTYVRLNKDATAPVFGWLASLSGFGPAFWWSVLALALLLGVAAWFMNRMRWGVPWYAFATIFFVVAGGLASGIVIDKGLKEYQKKRFIAFLSPKADPRGAGYNLRQSQIALGSGGVWGKGLFSGTQSQLGFLPERHTDFVFAVIGEETGFLGALVTLGLYLLVLWRLVSTARVARDGFGYLGACGLAGLFGFHLIINTGMAVGVLPVVGIPLPLLSYGGSSLVVSLWALGLAQSVYMRRYSF